MNKKLCIVVPYRNREENLKVFLPSMQRFLSNINYNILIVEQFDEKLFNRARLLNIGFDYVKDACDYVCFHDVDMIPIEADYGFPETPIHMATNASQFSYNLPYESYYGGVNLFSIQDFIKVNGYSNDYWGWGAEDDDMLKRIKHKGFDLVRRRGLYTSLEFGTADVKRNHSSYLENIKKLEGVYDYDSEGLNSLSYKLIGQLNIDDNVKVIKVI
jgi:predicted glycosyltransferase involved in capsule biosynthesis